MKHYISISAIVISLVVAGMGYSYAELIPGAPSVNPWPYVDPIREYYDNLDYRTTPHEPVYYPGFYIQPLNQVSCGLVPVYGIIPPDGILTFTVIIDDYIQFSNVSHNSEFSLINYLQLPCGLEGSAVLSVYFIYNDSTEFYRTN